MAMIRDGSDECSTSPLEWWDVLPTQTAIEKSYDVEYASLTPLQDSSSLEFVVPASAGEYIDLSNTKLSLVGVITKTNGNDLVATDVVAPVNDCLNSMFADVQLSLNDRPISHSNNMHGYISMISHLIHDSEESLHSERSMRLIYKDTPNQMDVTEARLPNKENNIPGHDIGRTAEDGYAVLPAEGVVGNSGLYQRYTLTRESKPVELLGRLRIDMFEQERYLPNGVSMKLRFQRQKDQYLLMSEGNFKFKLTSAHLLVRKVRPSAGVLTGHEAALLKMPAKYPIVRKDCNTIAVPAGMRGLKRDSLFQGQLPRRVVICMVDSAASAGAFTRNPYNFKHYNLTHMQLYKDGEPVRARPLKPNMATGSYIECYETLYRGLNNMDGEKGSIVKRVDWDKGYSLFAYDLTPDMDADDHSVVINRGNLRLEVEFAEPLVAPINILLYAEFDNIIEITADRNIQTDYV